MQLCRRLLPFTFAIAAAIGLAGCAGDLAVTTKALPDATVGAAYSFQLTGDNVDDWALFSGVLPPGIQLSTTGMLSGKPTLTGIFSFTVQALQQPSSAPTQAIAQGLSLTVK